MNYELSLRYSDRSPLIETNENYTPDEFKADPLHEEENKLTNY